MWERWLLKSKMADLVVKHVFVFFPFGLNIPKYLFYSKRGEMAGKKIGLNCQDEIVL